MTALFSIFLYILAQSIVLPGKCANLTGMPPVQGLTEISITLPTTTLNYNNSTNSDITDMIDVVGSSNVMATTINPTQANRATFSMTATLEEVDFINFTNSKILKIHDILAEKIVNNNTTQRGSNLTSTHSSVLTSIIPLLTTSFLNENLITTTLMKSNITNFTTISPLTTMNSIILENTTVLTTQNTNLPDNYFGFLQAASDTVDTSNPNISQLSNNSNILKLLHSSTQEGIASTTPSFNYSVSTSIIPISTDSHNSSQQEMGIMEFLGNQSQIQIHSTQRPDLNLTILQGPDQIKEQLSASGQDTMKALQSETRAADELATLINSPNLTSNYTLINLTSTSPSESLVANQSNTLATIPIGGESKTEITTIAVTSMSNTTTNSNSSLPESSMITPLESVTQIGTYVIGRNETIPTPSSTIQNLTTAGSDLNTIQSPIAEPIIDHNQSIPINETSARIIVNQTSVFVLSQNGSDNADAATPSITNTVLRVQSEPILNETLLVPLTTDSVLNASSTIANDMTTQASVSLGSTVYAESLSQAVLQSTYGSATFLQNSTSATIPETTQLGVVNLTENMATTEAIIPITNQTINYSSNLTSNANLTSDAFQDIQDSDDTFGSAPENDLAAHVMQFLGSIEPKNKTPPPSIKPHTFQNPVYQSVTFNGQGTTGTENDLVALMIASLQSNNLSPNASLTTKMIGDISLDLNTTPVVPTELTSPSTTLDPFTTTLANGSINNQTSQETGESNQTTVKQDLMSMMKEVLSQGTPPPATTYLNLQPVGTLPSIDTVTIVNTTHGDNGTDLVAMMKHFLTTDSLMQDSLSNRPQSEMKSVSEEDTSKMAKFMQDPNGRDNLDNRDFLTSHIMLQEGQLTSTPYGLAQQDLKSDVFMEPQTVFSNITNNPMEINLQAEKAITSEPIDLLRAMEDSLTTVQQISTLPQGSFMKNQTVFNDNMPFEPITSSPIDQNVQFNTQMIEPNSTNRPLDLLAAIQESLGPPSMTTKLQVTTTLIPADLHEQTFMTESIITKMPSTSPSANENSVDSSNVFTMVIPKELERAVDNETQITPFMSPPPSEASLSTSVILNASLINFDTFSTPNARGQFSGQVQELTLVPDNVESTVSSLGNDGANLTTKLDEFMMANMEVASSPQPFRPPEFPFLGANESFADAKQETDENAKGKYFEDIREQPGGEEVILEETTHRETVVTPPSTTISTTVHSVATESVTMPPQPTGGEDEGFVLRFNDNCHMQELNSQDKMTALLRIKERIQSVLGLSSQAPVSLLECEPFMKVKVTPLPLAPMDKSANEVMSRAETLIRQRSLTIPTPWRLGSNGERTMMADAIFPVNRNLPLETRGGGERGKGTYTHAPSSSAVIVIVLVVVVSFLIAIMVAVTFYHCVRRKRGSKDLLAHQLNHGGSSFVLAAGGGSNGGPGHGNYRLSGPGVFASMEGGGFIPPPYARSEMIDMKKLGHPGLEMPSNGGGGGMGNGMMTYYDGGKDAPATAPYYVKNLNNNNSNDGRASLASMKSFGSRMPLGAFSPGYVKKSVATVTPTNIEDEPKPRSDAEQLAAGLEAISGSSESTSGHGSSTAPSSQSGSYHGRKPPGPINHGATDILLGQNYNSILLDHNNNIPGVGNNSDNHKFNCHIEEELRRDSGVILDEDKTSHDKSPQMFRPQNGSVEVA